MDEKILVKDVDEQVSKVISYKLEKPAEKSASEAQFFQMHINEKEIDAIEEFFKNQVKTESVASLLMMEETGDDGGIIALSGFYFQFLVSIEYLIELLEGKWEYLLIDHHQDIIVFNEEKIRFIQVKTKNKDYSEVSKTKLHTEWIQKLFDLDKLFPNPNEYKTEFELVTNFIITNSKEIKVETYHVNEDFDLPIDRNNFFEKVEDHSKKTAKYERFQGDYLEKLLSKFKITKKDTFNYISILEKKIGNLFSDNLSAKKEDIDFLIGYMCSTCYYPKNPQLQFIDRDKAEQLKYILKDRVIKGARAYLETNDSKVLLDKYLCKLQDSFSNSPFYNTLNADIKIFESDLKKYIDNGGNIFTIISRYKERCEYSSKINQCKEHDLINYTGELLDITFLIKLANEGELKIDDTNKRLLLKEIGSKKYSFFNLEDIDEFSNAIEKFKDVINVLEYQEFLSIFKRGYLQLVFVGDFDEDDFPEDIYHIELSPTNMPTYEELDEKDTAIQETLKKITEGNITQVDYKAFVINGNHNKVSKCFRKRKKYSDVLEYKSYLKEELLMER